MHCKSDGFVLRTLPFKEGDRLVTLFTRDQGLLHCVAKGSRKLKSRTCSLLEPYYKNHFVLYRSPNRELYTITQVTARNPFNRVREDLATYAFACGLTEILLNYLEPESRDVALFDLIEHTITRMAAGDDPKTAFRVFEFRFIAHAGYLFQLNHCVSCKQYIASPRLFSLAQGGLICSAACANPVVPGARAREIQAVGPGAIQFLHRVFTEPLSRLVRYKLTGSADRAIDRISLHLHRQYTGKKINSLQFFSCIN